MTSLARFFGFAKGVPAAAPRPAGYPLPADLLKSVEGKSDAETSTVFSQYRTGLSTHRTQLSEHRTSLSDARSYMANERTHLAQLRTGVSLMSFGITLNRFSIYLEENDRTPQQFRDLSGSASIGAGMVVLGIGLLVWSLFHYRRVQRQIERNDFRPAHTSVVVLTLLIVVLGLVSTGFMILPWIKNLF
ncbi:MAG: DUF202 domain-containing protein [Alphaproteobacteria bacterium]